MIDGIAKYFINIIRLLVRLGLVLKVVSKSLIYGASCWKAKNLELEKGKNFEVATMPFWHHLMQRSFLETAVLIQIHILKLQLPKHWLYRNEAE